MENIIVSEQDITKYRAWEYLEHSTRRYSIEDLSQVDVTLQGFYQKSWELDKGRRIKRDYLNTRGEVIVRFLYEYIETQQTISDYVCKVQLFTDTDSVGIEKTLLKEKSDAHLVALNINVRENQINHLRGQGNSLRIKGQELGEPYLTQYLMVADNVDTLWVHYKDVITDYVQTGSMLFNDAVVNEVDLVILDVLSVADKLGNTVSEIILTEIN